MRLTVLDRGHSLPTKALFAVIRLMTRQPVVDAVKLALYRTDFYGAGPLTHEAMRGPSQWSVGDRELMAAVVSQANQCLFCVAAHSATSSQAYGDPATVQAVLADLDTAPISEPLRATLRMLTKPCTPDDIRAALAEGVTPQQITDALNVALVFGITNRLANAFGFDVAGPEAMNAGAKHLLKRGYR
ncbi:carboxymuconolactone decarboxylase family protein [Mycobacterium gordonae]|uniref:carboxymuconolactone decarboxylase family protein n=1 Tax=Mycobacterium gordonae TaxID=1778 RepID=UPI002109C236|nr:carboxymuconolactone decarboxylase family protein [Mycobacterium gordonae]MCQ4364530.1 carboxymuconolactone decarboxylase family protein [Mycobacterium gordonae]